MKNRFEIKISSLFPKRCAFCGKRIPGDRRICDECKASLPRIEGEICPWCGRGKQVCACRRAEKYYDGIAAPFYFEGNVRKGIHAYKFSKARGNSDALAFEMAKAVKERFPGVEFDYITQAPMTESDIKARGYDQCAILAEKISGICNIEYNPGVIKKLYKTEKQHGLNIYLRRGNLTGVFDVTNPDDVRGKTILLCDDISTSGETLNECAKMLWLNDARAVYCITAALTKSKKK